MYHNTGDFTTLPHPERHELVIGIRTVGTRTKPALHKAVKRLIESPVPEGMTHKICVFNVDVPAKRHETFYALQDEFSEAVAQGRVQLFEGPSLEDYQLTPGQLQIIRSKGGHIRLKMCIDFLRVLGFLVRHFAADAYLMLEDDAVFLRKKGWYEIRDFSRERRISRKQLSFLGTGSTSVLVQEETAEKLLDDMSAWAKALRPDNFMPLDTYLFSLAGIIPYAFCDKKHIFAHIGRYSTVVKDEDRARDYPNLFMPFFMQQRAFPYTLRGIYYRYLICAIRGKNYAAKLWKTYVPGAAGQD